MSTKYEYGRVVKLDEQLRAAKVPVEIITAIMAGGETVRKTAKQPVKVAWLRGAMERMDNLRPTNMHTQSNTNTNLHRRN